MTVEALAHRAVHVERPAPGEWIVPAGPVRAKDIAIEPDLSNASPFLAAAMVAGGSVTVTGWPLHSTQPARSWSTSSPRWVRASAVAAGPSPSLPETTASWGSKLDLSAAGELAPTLFGLAAFADGPTTLHGIGHIRGHETDRIAALVGNFRSLGGEAHELDDGIRIVPRPLHSGVWQAHHDHRMATTGALIGLRVPGVQVDDIGRRPRPSRSSPHSGTPCSAPTPR